MHINILSTNWITYKERTLTVIGVKGLMCYADGCAVRPAPFKVNDKTKHLEKANGTEPTEAEVEVLDKK
jgi:hypothetical protein